MSSTVVELAQLTTPRTIAAMVALLILTPNQLSHKPMTTAVNRPMDVAMSRPVVLIIVVLNLHAPVIMILTLRFLKLNTLPAATIIKRETTLTRVAMIPPTNHTPHPTTRIPLARKAEATEAPVMVIETQTSMLIDIIARVARIATVQTIAAAVERTSTSMISTKSLPTKIEAINQAIRAVHTVETIKPTIME